MLQAGRMEFDAGHWEDALARVELARAEAEEGMALARPRYQSKAERLNDLARERALEADATAIPGVQTHLERDHQVQRVVLVLRGLFGGEGSVLSPEGARILGAVTTVVARYPRYPLQVTGYVGRQGGEELALARANAVYWALVTRGIDPKRLNVDGRGADAAGAEVRPAERAAPSRIEVSIPYHVGD
jgi:outer membrane protein OmpA-like peptidoglycan-associated protein